MNRRDWLRAAVVGASTGWAARSTAQDAPAPGIMDSSNLFLMDQSAARSVRLPSKPGASPVMTPDQRDELEHQIRCQCGCTLSVYVCRTTDFSCQVSPAMHRDILALVAGGYDDREITDAFVKVYGDRALMAPPREGFNVLGYVLPGIAIGVGAIVLAVIMRRWKRPPEAAPDAHAAIEGSPEELDRLEAAIRNDS